MSVYTVAMADATIVADATLIIVHTATGVARGASIEVLRVSVGQRGSDTSDQLGIIIGQKASVFPTVTAATPSPHFLGGPASGIAGGTAGAAATAGVDASAEGAGAVTNTVTEAFNNLNGWLWVPTPEERIIVPADTAIIVKLVGTPATLTGWYADLSYLETT